MKKFGFIALVGLGLFVAFAILKKTEKNSVEDSNHLTGYSVTQVDHSLIKAQTAVVSLPTQTEKSPLVPVAKMTSTHPSLVHLAPKVEQLRAQVMQNPHDTPKALLDFADQMGERFDQAEKGEAEARQLMNELSDCVKDESQLPVQVKALCLANAKRFSERHTEFAQVYQALFAGVGEKVSGLVR
jgi:hypothetical protein